MAEAYPVELRERVVWAYEAGEGSYPTVAARFSIGEATVKRWVWMFRNEGRVDPRPRGGGTPSLIMLEDIEELMARLGDPTAGELTAELNRGRRGRQRVHVSSMKRALHRHGYVVKKNADGRWRFFAPTSKPSERRS
jgi:transposase